MEKKQNNISKFKYIKEKNENNFSSKSNFYSF